MVCEFVYTRLLWGLIWRERRKLAVGEFSCLRDLRGGFGVL